MPEPQRVTLAHLLRPQGRKGELLAELLTDFPEKFTGRVVQVGQEGKSAEYTIESYFLPTGRNAGRVVLKFANVDSINDAEKLNGLDVTIPEEARAPLEEDAAYISDLVGCTVFNGEREVGLIEDVSAPVGSVTLDLPSMLVVRSADGREHLVPFVKAYIVSIDTAAKRIRMRLPEGLLEINS
ncbi:MAG TPA: ribosome maturation factor RimM [Acidobacteriaceae bacterium]|nr:ribosome maturation factor RimM [Acidobacteriaceae bacterium]